MDANEIVENQEEILAAIEREKLSNEDEHPCPSTMGWKNWLFSDFPQGASVVI